MFIIFLFWVLAIVSIPVIVCINADSGKKATHASKECSANKNVRFHVDWDDDTAPDNEWVQKQHQQFVKQTIRDHQQFVEQAIRDHQQFAEQATHFNQQFTEQLLSDAYQDQFDALNDPITGFDSFGGGFNDFGMFN